MTSIFLLTRMPVHLRDEWIANMRSQTSPWERENLDICTCGEPVLSHEEGKIINHKFEPRKEMFEVQWKMNPIELWECVVPDNAVAEVLWYNKVKTDEGGQVHDNIMKWKKKLFQWGLKLEDVKNYEVEKLQVRPRLIMNTGVTIYCLGVKKDVIKDYDFGVEGRWKQEGL